MFHRNRLENSGKAELTGPSPNCPPEDCFVSSDSATDLCLSGNQNFESGLLL